jgi:hypothetical protein
MKGGILAWSDKVAHALVRAVSALVPTQLLTDNLDDTRIRPR